ncbi:MAG TPA: hypothetical protein VII45_01915 [Solirubrobacterales bacterium]
MPTAVAGEERGRQTLACLVQRFALQRGNWEVDYPEMVEKVLAMASGREPLCGRFAAVAGDPSYTFIEVTATEADALDRLAIWTADEHYPKCPLALADLHEGSIYPVAVTVSRAAAPRPSPEEGPRC